MKIGFNEATALECEGQSLMADLKRVKNMDLIISRSVLTV